MREKNREGTWRKENVRWLNTGNLNMTCQASEMDSFGGESVRSSSA